MTKLLIVTQEMDTKSPTLGFFPTWVSLLAPYYEHVEVICLKEGAHTLPGNVRVHSLGKERGSVLPIVYSVRFKWLAWKLRRDYDAVFVHMNQEYILIAGPMWKLLGKRIYMWRNHYAGSWLTDIAAAFCAKVFCTSKHSYTAKYKKTVLMPVGVDTSRFLIEASVVRVPRSILFLARIAPSKRAEMLIEALALLHKEGEAFQASIYGSPTVSDEDYYEGLKARVQELGLTEHITFYPGPLSLESPAIYQAHEVFVNCSPSGMYDKTLFEAAACGCLVLASSEDFKKLNDDGSYFTNVIELSFALTKVLNLSVQQMEERTALLRTVSRSNSLSSLCLSLSKHMGSPS